MWWGAGWVSGRGRCDEGPGVSAAGVGRLAVVLAAVGMGWARVWGWLECVWVFCPECGRAVGWCGLVCDSVWRGLGAVSVVEGV